MSRVGLFKADKKRESERKRVSQEKRLLTQDSLQQFTPPTSKLIQKIKQKSNSVQMSKTLFVFFIFDQVFIFALPLYHGYLRS